MYCNWNILSELQSANISDMQYNLAMKKTTEEWFYFEISQYASYPICNKLATNEPNDLAKLW
jgi:hypothetical protein